MSVLFIYLYADDTGLPFCSRADLEQQTPLLMTHFADWGMEIHAGVLDPMVHSGLLDFTALPPIKKSKSEVLFCSKPHHLYSDPTSFDGTDLSPILLPNNGFMEVVDRFPYLGDIVSRDGDDAAAVDARVESGGKAFGALRACIFASTSISNKAKKAVYEAIVLSTVLYGCETWSLTEELYRRLRCMHAHHLRAMCRVSRSSIAQPGVGASYLDPRAGTAAGVGLHRVLHRSPAARVAWTRQPHALRDEAPSPLALGVGAPSPPDRFAVHDVRPLHLQGARDVPHRQDALARARREPQRMARDLADGRCPASLLAAGSTAAGQAPVAHKAPPEQRAADPSQDE